MMRRAHQMFCGGLRRSVWTIRLKRRFFGKERLFVLRQAAHDLVRRNMYKASDAAFTRRIQQHLRAEDVRRNEFMCGLNTPIYMRFGGEIDDYIAAVTKRIDDRFGIPDIPPTERVP